jgi:hypothetical protein
MNLSQHRSTPAQAEMNPSSRLPSIGLKRILHYPPTSQVLPRQLNLSLQVLHWNGIPYIKVYTTTWGHNSSMEEPRVIHVPAAVSQFRKTSQKNSRQAHQAVSNQMANVTTARQYFARGKSFVSAKTDDQTRRMLALATAPRRPPSNPIRPTDHPPAMTTKSPT